MTKKILQLVVRDSTAPTKKSSPPIEREPQFLKRLLEEGMVHGDAEALLPRLPRESVDLFFTSPPLCGRSRLQPYPS
ncbi:MAG: hypothetical protein LCH79_11760 [Proteobacteria bacterium]|nr:hypothetical protein [Pseudomonadota bacterium]